MLRVQEAIVGRMCRDAVENHNMQTSKSTTVPSWS